MVAAANIFDLDFLLLTALGIPGGQHHYYPGHTPLIGLVYWLAIYLLFKNKLASRVFLLAGFALLSHLVIDDLSYWLSLIGLEKYVPSQINWLYPFTEKESSVEPFSNAQVLRFYLVETPKLFYLEILAILTAIFVWFKINTPKVCR